ncbi:MAG: signal recognition particle-docking protein FtsY [Clostridia bacterium]|nr:signal recognition particle-docking protein FtsY [Clostridia bacterium]
MGFFKKLFSGLKKTATAVTNGIASIFTKTFDDEFYEDLETVLLAADMGVAATEKIIADLKQTVKAEKIKTEEELKQRLAESIAEILGDEQPEIIDPTVLMVVGVNGVGKTTSIGKLAHLYKQEGKSVLLVAADTFRAAATEQLTEWSERAKVRIVKQGAGADPASLVFDALTSMKAKQEQVALVDTAGRLHNKVNLMAELQKIDRVVGKVMPEANYRKVLVIDATTGGNALSQVEYFHEAVGLDGIILTKLDGTAKGGIVVAIKQQFNLPVWYVGVGEQLGDLVPFDATEFAAGLVGIDA